MDINLIVSIIFLSFYFLAGVIIAFQETKHFKVEKYSIFFWITLGPILFPTDKLGSYLSCDDLD